MNRVKILLLPCLLIAVMCKGQKFILLDRGWERKAITTDSITQEQLNNGWFPIYKNQLDSFISRVDKLKNLKEDGIQRKNYNTADFKMENIDFTFENIRRTYGDGYEINIISKVYQTSSLKICDSRENLPKNEKRIREFLSYLNKSRSKLAKN